MESSFVNALLEQPHLPSPVFCLKDATVEMIVEKVCACLNDAGGWIVVGVDDKHKGVGLPNEGFVSKIQEAITNGIMPLPLVYVQDEKFEGKNVVLVTIPKGTLAPYTYKGRYYVLQEGEAVVPTQDYMAQLLRNSTAVRSDWERVNNLYASEDDLDAELMANVYNKGVSLGRLSKNNNGLRGLLSELQMLRANEITNGTLALFARDTRKLLPQCRLRIQVMTRGKGAEEFDDISFMEGNIFKVQKQTIDYFKERLPKIAYFFKDKTGRYDNFAYPIDVLDEAISNALIHRDYTDISDEVAVFVYRDKLEIINSGSLPQKLVTGKTRVHPHGSVLRNPLMAELFYVAGEMEKTGRGMFLISDTMREAGRKLPEWTSSNGKTTLTIYNRKEKRALNDRVDYFLTQWEKGAYFSRADYERVFEGKLSRGTVQNDLLLMVELGFSEKHGNGPSTRYKLL